MSLMISRQGTIISTFDHEEDAQAAIHDLQSMGFNDTHLGVAAQFDEHTSVFKDDSAKTAAIGAVAGLGAGTLWGLGVIGGVLPGIGPAIAGGALAALLSSAAAGAATVSLAGALIGLGISDEDAHRIDSEFRAGKTVVTVKAGDRGDLAMEVLNRYHSVVH